MRFLIIFGSKDRYSYDVQLFRSLNSNDYSDNDFQHQMHDYKQAFEQKTLSALKIMYLEINPEDMSITVLENLDVKNPLKKKTVVNPEVLAVREKRQKERGAGLQAFLKAKPMNPNQAIFDALIDGAPQWDTPMAPTGN